MLWNKKTVSLALGLALAVATTVVSADFTLGTPTNLGAPVNSTQDEWPVCMSADGLEFYFACDNRPGGYGKEDLWVSTRPTTADEWGIPVNLGEPVNSAEYEGAACISTDGLSLYFSSSRAGGLGEGYDLYLTTRASVSDPWGQPVNLGPTVNSTSRDAGPWLSAGGLELYFHSDRPGGIDPWDIWVTRRATINDAWGPPINLGAVVNSPALDIGPVISADGLLLLFTSQRPGGFDNWDIWMTRRASISDPWGPPVNLGPMVNSSSDDFSPLISPDGSTLYFCRGGRGEGDIWQAPIIPTTDFNGDNRVDIEDLIILIEHWGQNEPACDTGPTPLGDGTIDAADLEVLMRYWGQDANFIAHWELDETGGDIAYDSIADNDAVVLGEALWQREGGLIEGALQFDGIDDYLLARFILDPVKQPFSAFAWIKGGQPGQTVISQQGAFGAWLSVDPAGALATGLTFPLPAVTSDVVITDDQWHHIGLVSDGSGMSLYVDDVEVVRSDASPILPATGDLHIGAGNNLEPGTFWSGMIDDVRIYDRAEIP